MRPRWWSDAASGRKQQSTHTRARARATEPSGDMEREHVSRADKSQTASLAPQPTHAREFGRRKEMLAADQEVKWPRKRLAADAARCRGEAGRARVSIAPRRPLRRRASGALRHGASGTGIVSGARAHGTQLRQCRRRMHGRLGESSFRGTPDAAGDNCCLPTDTRTACRRI